MTEQPMAVDGEPGEASTKAVTTPISYDKYRRIATMIVHYLRQREEAGGVILSTLLIDRWRGGSCEGQGCGLVYQGK